MNRKALIPFVLFVALLGCARDSSRSPGPSVRDPNQQIDPERLQAQMMAYADSFVTLIGESFDDLAVRAPTEEAITFAMKRKVAVARGAYIKASNANPIEGLMDMLVLVSLARHSCD